MDDLFITNQDVYRSWVSRAVIVSDKPLVSLEEEALCYSVFPPGSAAGNEDAPIYVIHQSAETMACPKGECKSIGFDRILALKLTAYTRCNLSLEGG